MSSMSMSISIWSERTSVVLLENELDRRNLSTFGNKNELLGRLTVSDLKLPIEADPDSDFAQCIELRASGLWCLNLKELRSILRKMLEKHYIGSGVKKELVEKIVREEGKRGGFGINSFSAVPPPTATYQTLPVQTLPVQTLPVHTQPIHTQPIHTQQQQQAQAPAQAAQQQQACAQVQPGQQAAAIQAARVAQAQALQSQQPNQNQPPAQNQQQQQQQYWHQQPQAAPHISNLPINPPEFPFAPQPQPPNQPQFRIPSPQNPPRISLASQHRTQFQSQRNHALLATKSTNVKIMYEDNTRDMRQAVEILLGDVARITREKLV